MKQPAHSATIGATMEELGATSYQAIAEAMANSAPLFVVLEVLFNNLVQELGDIAEAVAWLAQLANRIGHPVALHVEGITTFLSPEGWTDERLQGWVAVHAAELEQAFGRAVSIQGPADFGLAGRLEGNHDEC